MKSIQCGRYSFTRPAHIESLLKHPYFPDNFGESFDEIMSADYGMKESRAKMRLSKYAESLPEATLLSARASIQQGAIILLMEDAKKWIESKDSSYKHRVNLKSFGEGFREYFKKGDEYEFSWDRMVTAINTFFDEELLPAYPESKQLQQRCEVVSNMLDPNIPVENQDVVKKFLKEFDDLQWYFDNWCVGVTEIDDIPENKEILTKPEVQTSEAPKMTARESVDSAVYACDGKLMALPDGSIYIDDREIEDVDPCVGKTLYALIKKRHGYVSPWDIARCVYDEKVGNPAAGRKSAIRKYVSIARKLLKRYFPACRIDNKRGEGYSFHEQVKKKVSVT